MNSRPNEIRNRHGRRRKTASRRLLLASTALTAALLAAPRGYAEPPMPAPNATPQGGQVVGGSAGIAQGTGSTTITQSSQRAAIDWQSFNVGSNAHVTFVQPNAQAIALNRVISENPSIIAGRIDANGQIVLMNQSGVVFAHGSQVNAESLIVSTSGISAKNFMAGKLIFDQPPHPGARIVNDGRITMKQAGLAAFVAPQVVNRGTVTARLGHVIIAGASAFTLDISGDGLVSIDVTKAVRKVDLGGRTVNALVTNSGTIIADGGTVTLTARAVDGLIQQLLDVRGTIEADSVGKSRGGITISGIGGDLQVAGNLLARGTAVGSQGGTIGIDATGNVSVAGTARIDTSGDSGGGVIAIGTDPARALAGRADKSAPRAASVTIDKGAPVAADATRSGKGGTITILSHEKTVQNGALSARGAGGQRGGFTEISSDGVISLSGTENVLSPGGKAGDILLDPATLIIGSGSAAGASYIDPNSFDALSGNVSLAADTLVAVQAAVTNTGATSVTFNSGGAVSIGASMSLGGSLEIDAGTSIVIGAGVHDNTRIALSAGNGVSEITGGFLDTPVLTTGAGSIGGDAALTNPNSISTVSLFTIGGTFLFNDATDLTVGGSLSAASATLVAHSIDFNAPVLIANTLALSSGVGISQSSSGMISADTLVSYNTTTADVLLDSATNTITTLGSFDATGTFSLNDTGTALEIAGALNAASATLSAAGLDFEHAISITNTLALASTAGITQGSSGKITAGTLTSDGGTIIGGDVSLTAANTIATLGDFDATGSVILNEARNLLIAGNVSVANTFALGDTDSITETGGISAATLTSYNTIGGNVSLGDSNTIGTLGSFDTSGTLTLNDAGIALEIAGSLNAAGATLAAAGLDFENAVSVTNALALASTAGITQGTSGAITAGTLTSDGGTITGGDVSLTAANSIATLGDFDAAGNAILDDTSALTVAGPFSAANTTLDAAGFTIPGSITTGNLSLATAGSIVGTGAITANTLTGSAGSLVSLTGANIIGSLGNFTDAGSVTLNDTAPLTIAGFVSVANTLALGDTGSIAETGSITAATLASYGTVGGDVSLTGTNTIASLGDFADTGNVILDDTSALTVAGPFSAANATLDADGLDFTGQASVAGVLALASNSGISQGSDGTIIAGTLTSDGGTITGGDVSLTAANTIATLGAFNAADAFALNDSGAALDIAGALNAASATLSAAGLDFEHAVSITNTLALASTAGITQGSSGKITAGTLTSDGGTITGGDVSLTAANSIATLGNFDAAGGFALNDAGASLDLTGALDAASATLIAPALTFASAVSVGTSGAIDLIADRMTDMGAGFSAPSGTIILAPLTPGTPVDFGSSATSALAIAPSLASALAGSGEDDFILGRTTLDGRTYAAGSIALEGALPAFTGTLDIVADGGIANTASLQAATLSFSGTSFDSTGAITATDLSGSVSGAASLANSANAIGTVPGLVAGHGILLADSAPLTLGGTLSVGSGAAIDLAADSMAATGATRLIAPDGTVSLAPLTAGREVAIGGSTANALDLSTALLGDIDGSAATLILGDSASGTLDVLGAVGFAIPDVILHGASIVIGADLSAANTLDLESTAGVLGTAGITAGTLIGSAGADVSLTGANTIASLGSFADAGNLVLDDTSALTIAGPVSAANATLDAAGFAIPGSITTGNLSLATAGSIIGTGIITANTLTGSAGGDVSLTGANTIATLGNLTGTGNVTLNDTRNLLIEGNVSIANTLALGDTGSITGTGSITAATLASYNTIGGNVSLIGSNTIASLGDFADTGNLILDDTSTLTVAGPVSAANATLDATGFAIPGSITTDTLSFATAGSITGTGIITANTLTGSAGGDVSLTGANSIASLGAFNATGNIVLDDTSALTVAGPFSAANTTLDAAGFAIPGSITTGTLSLATAGSIIGTGIITANTLTGSAGSLVSLTGNNSIASLGNLSASDATIDDARNLLIDGNVSVANTLALGDAGAIAETGNITAATLASYGTVGGDVSLTGANSIATLGNFADAGNLVLDDASQLTVAGPVSAANATLIAAGFAIPGSITTGNLSLTTIGSITGSGAITANTLTGSAGSLVSLTGANSIASLGNFTGTGNVTLNDTRTLLIAGNVSVANTLALGDTGSITGTGNITAGTLASYGTVGGDVSLIGSNTIASLGDFADAGNVILDDTSTLTVAGPFSAANATLDAAGFAIPGSITTGNLSFATAGSIAGTGIITANTLTGSAGSLVSLTGNNSIASLGAFSATGNVILDDASQLTVAGPFSAANATLIAAGFAIPGSITTGTLSLATAGSIISTGIITANTLTGSAGGDVSLTGANTIATLGNLTASNATIDDTRNLLIDGNVSIANTLALGDSGVISETGSITAATLASYGTVGGDVSLTGANSIATLGNFADAGNLVLDDASQLTVAGSVSAANATLIAAGMAIPGTISTPGTLALGGSAIGETGAIDTRLLQSAGAIGGDVSLAGANRIATLGGFNDIDHVFSLIDDAALDIAGIVTANAVSITATGQMVLDGAAGGGLNIGGGALPSGTQVNPVPRTGTDSVLTVTQGQVQQLVQTGTFNIDTGTTADGTGLAGHPNTVFILLQPNGSAAFNNLNAPDTSLVLELGAGKAHGQVNLKYLVVSGGAAGSVNFTGQLGSLTGSTAAHNSAVVPIPQSNYRFNSCIIGSVNCTVIPILSIPQASPLQSFDLNPTRRRRLDRNVLLPGVAAKDY